MSDDDRVYCETCRELLYDQRLPAATDPMIVVIHAAAGHELREGTTPEGESQ